jgi:hypothetical protein
MEATADRELERWCECETCLLFGDLADSAVNDGEARFMNDTTIVDF